MVAGGYFAEQGGQLPFVHKPSTDRPMGFSEHPYLRLDQRYIFVVGELNHLFIQVMEEPVQYELTDVVQKSREICLVPRLDAKL